LAFAIVGCDGAEQRVNHPPVLTAQTVATDEDVPVEIPVLDGARDADGDALRVVDAAAIDHTVKIVDGAVLLVTPQHDFHGMFTVTYHITDRTTVATGQATVTVRPVNDAPTADGQTLSFRGKTTIMLSAHDADGDALRFEIVARPANGTLTGDGPSVDYEPAAGFSGDDVFSYRVNDGTATSEVATIRLRVIANSLPTAFNGAAGVDEDRAMSLMLFALDADNDPLTYTIERRPEHAHRRSKDAASPARAETRLLCRGGGRKSGRDQSKFLAGTSVESGIALWRVSPEHGEHPQPTRS